MFKARYILAAFVGVLAAAAVWCWPASPLWRKQVDFGRLNGFSADGETIVTSRDWVGKDPRRSNPEVCRWDATTGKLLSRAELPCAKAIGNGHCHEVWPSPDGQRALVGEGPCWNGSLSLGTGDWYLHDGMSGQRLAGPIAGVNRGHRDSFSPDGRWFVGHRGDPQAGLEKAGGVGGIDIYSAATGELVVGLPEKDGCEARLCRFAPDGTSALINWVPKGSKPDFQPQTVRVIELPSGLELRRCELAPHPRLYFKRWDGRYLHVNQLATTGTSGKTIHRGIMYDLAQEPIPNGAAIPFHQTEVNDDGKEVDWRDGPGWLIKYARVSSKVSQKGLAGWFDWLIEKVGLGRAPAPPVAVNVRFVNPVTGATLFELPHPVSPTFFVSPDGRRLVSEGAGPSLEIWDTDPPPRWPLVLLAGFGAMGGVLALATWQQRRRNRLQSKSLKNPGE